MHLLRYSHSELITLTGKGVEVNCDGHSHFLQGMRKDLLRTVETPKEGLTYTATPEVLDEFKERYPDISWELFDWRDKYEEGSIEEWATQWNGKKKACVGPDHLHKIPFWDDPVLLLRVRNENCYLEKAWAVHMLKNLLGCDFDVVFFSACVLSEILIYDFHERFPDTHLIDTGALFDPFCGVNSRAYHTKRK